MRGQLHGTPRMTRPVVVLFREDLRLTDNRALHAAAGTGRPLVAVFILDDESAANQHHGGAWRWWLHHSITALQNRLRNLGGRLILCRGPHRDVVDTLLIKTGTDTVHWNHRYHPAGAACDAALARHLQNRGVEAVGHDGHLLHEPSQLMTGSGRPYRVFTPFWRALQMLDGFAEPLPAPGELRFVNWKIPTEELEDWQLCPRSPNWANGLDATWMPGEAAALARLDAFIDTAVDSYATRRDLPALPATSSLSPYLAHGEISPRTIWHRVHARAAGIPAATAFLREVAWREFCYHLLVHHPGLGETNLDARFDAFVWREAPQDLAAWQQGRTGIPIVDAGMRQLWRTGWMHNRVRMIAASLLVKHLLIDWREGERWFADTLVDADPANNPANWQWVAGTSPHASPFFRIFNPVLQSKKFDASGTYLQRYLPELAGLDGRSIHMPSHAPASELDRARIGVDSIYRAPIVDLVDARKRALAEFRALSDDMRLL